MVVDEWSVPLGFLWPWYIGVRDCFFFKRLTGWLALGCRPRRERKIFYVFEVEVYVDFMGFSLGEFVTSIGAKYVMVFLGTIVVFSGLIIESLGH